MVCAQEDIVSAMALTGQIVMGQAIMVKSSEVRSTSPPSLSTLLLGVKKGTAVISTPGIFTWKASLQAEKNLAWEAAQAQSASVAQMSSLATAGAGPCKLYVKNLHPNITVSHSYLLRHSQCACCII